MNEDSYWKWIWLLYVAKIVSGSTIFENLVYDIDSEELLMKSS